MRRRKWRWQWRWFYFSWLLFIRVLLLICFQQRALYFYILFFLFFSLHVQLLTLLFLPSTSHDLPSEFLQFFSLLFLLFQTYLTIDHSFIFFLFSILLLFYLLFSSDLLFSFSHLLLELFLIYLQKQHFRKVKLKSNGNPKDDVSDHDHKVPPIAGPIDLVISFI